MSNGAYILLAASSTAGVAALVSFSGMLMTKEQSISEFRQKWINELREEIAEFLSITIYFSDIKNISYHEKKSTMTFLNEHHEISLNFNKACKKLQLRLNSEEYEHEIDLIKNIIDNLSSGLSEKSEDEINQLNSQLTNLTNEFTELSKIILKKEWEKVKIGEGLIIHLFIRIRDYLNKLIS